MGCSSTVVLMELIFERALFLMWASPICTMRVFETKSPTAVEGGKQRAAVAMTASTAPADSTKLCVLINTKVIPALEALRHCPVLTLCRGGKFRGLCSVGGGFQHTLLLPGGSWAEHWELHGWEMCSPSTGRLQGTEKASGAEVWRAGLRDGEMKGRAQFQCNLYSQRQKGAGWGWYNSLSTNSLKQRRTELGPFLQHSQLPLSRSRGWCWESSHSWGPTTESLQHHLRTRWFSEGRTLLRLLPKPSLGFPPPLIYQKYINRKDCSPPT